MSSSGFIWSVKNGDLEAVKKELEAKRPDFNVNDVIEGRTALHFAADYGHVEVIERLLEAGANINEKDNYGITPLLAAIWEGHPKAVQLLLKKGADKNGRSPDDKSYLECAETDEMKLVLKNFKV